MAFLLASAYRLEVVGLAFSVGGGVEVAVGATVAAGGGVGVGPQAAKTKSTASVALNMRMDMATSLQFTSAGKAIRRAATGSSGDQFWQQGHTVALDLLPEGRLPLLHLGPPVGGDEVRVNQRVKL